MIRFFYFIHQGVTTNHSEHYVFSLGFIILIWNENFATNQVEFWGFRWCIILPYLSCSTWVCSPLFSVLENPHPPCSSLYKEEIVCWLLLLTFIWFFLDIKIKTITINFSLDDNCVSWKSESMDREQTLKEWFEEELLKEMRSVGRCALIWENCGSDLSRGEVKCLMGDKSRGPGHFQPLSPCIRAFRRLYRTKQIEDTFALQYEQHPIKVFSMLTVLGYKIFFYWKQTLIVFSLLSDLYFILLQS